MAARSPTTRLSRAAEISVTANLTLINNGTIDANQTAALTINPNGGTTNTNTMEATAGGTLHLLDYTINNTGGTILATGASSVVTLDAVSISGGTLTSSSGGILESVDAWNSTLPTLTGVTISGGSTLDIPNNDGLDLGAGTITNNGTINLQSTGNNTELTDRWKHHSERYRHSHDVQQRK